MNRPMRFLALACAIGVLPCSWSLAAPSLANVSRPVWSPDNARLALTDAGGNGVYVYDVDQQSLVRLTDAPSSGAWVEWSPDGSRLGFKLFEPAAGDDLPPQMAAVYRTGAETVAPLISATRRAGVPSFSTGGRMAFTVGNEVQIVDADGSTVARHDLGHYVNLARLSPDGRHLAYNGRDGQIWRLDVETGDRERLTDGSAACFNPVWSPDGGKLAVETVAGNLLAVDLPSRRVYPFGAGSQPCWAPDGRHVVFTRTVLSKYLEVESSDLYCVRYDGKKETRLTEEADEHEAGGHLSRDGSRIAYVSLKTGRLHVARISPAAKTGSGDVVPFRIGAIQEVVLPESAEEIPVASRRPRTVKQAVPKAICTMLDVPYLHQVYDTRDDFTKKHSACGASSALMALNYSETLPYWDCTCASPSSHTSHYGQYVSEIYTNNGVVYNIHNGVDTTEYGGYGYITQNDWEETRGWMRQYILNHGKSSGTGVDWSPTWDELTAEIRSGSPFVLLNLLTTSGHYITTIGFYDNQYTAIFNDPYGNRNTPGYPSYDGAGAKYDWPGYNNGYSNLNVVACFIYCRESVCNAGAIRVAIDEPAPVGAQWRVDDGAWFDSDEVATNAFAGSHVVSFAHVAGWREPSRMTLPVAEGLTNSVHAAYEELDVLLSEGFNDSALPVGWALATNAVGSGTGIDPVVSFVTTSTYTNATPYEGTHFVKFNSWDCRSGAVVRLSSPAFATTNGAGVDVEFAWYQRSRTNKFAEGVTVQWSPDGATWNDLEPFFPRQGPLGWERFRVSLPQAAMGDESVQVAFEFFSNYGDNCYLDDVQIVRTDQLLAEGFNGDALPADWSADVVTDPGTDPALAYVTSSEHENASPFEGYRYVSFNSWDCASGAELRLVAPALSTEGRTNVAVHFAWFQDVRTGYDAEGMTVQWSTNGTDWTSDAAFHSRRGASVGWTNLSVTLPAGAEEQATLYVGFLFHSLYGNNCYLDDVRIAADADFEPPEEEPWVPYAYEENFESGWGIWQNGAGDDFDWTRLSGPTPSEQTGPPSGYGGSGSYLYVEATGTTPNSNAVLEAAFDFGDATAPRLWFYYHMFDYSLANMGTLSVDVSTNGGAAWDLGVWSKSGAQQWKTNSMWGQATVDLAPYGGQTGVVVRFRGTTGTDYRSDMAIDAVRILDAPTLAFQGFEGAAADTWSYACEPGEGGLISPDSTALVRDGTYACRLRGSASGTAHPAITFTNVPLYGHTNVALLVPHAATGLNTDVDFYLDYSTNRGVSWTSAKLIDGNDAWGDLAYDACGPYEERNPQMANPWTVFLPADAVQVSVRARLQESAGDRTSNAAFLDSIQLVGVLADPDYDGDADGMPDLWEAQQFPEGVEAMPEEDSDSDGPSNYAECIAGTDPTSATSLLELAPMATNMTATANLIFRWPSATGRVYSIMRATNASGPYTQHVGNLSAHAPTNSYTNAVPASLGIYFYGIGVQLVP
ncbi:MAG: choice-of-anchor J domain-containing protein [Kiritimatiellia bacterium]